MPVNWLDWERQSFEKSLRWEKPILLSLSESWSFLSRKMDEKTYTQPKVAELINGNFIPIRVEANQRPDLNLRYSQGGPPSTVFLDKGGRVITGSTYVPAEEMADLLTQVIQIFGNDGSKIGNFEDRREKAEETSFEEKRLYLIKYRENFIRKYEELLLLNFDESFGGFGPSAGGFGSKFPMASALEFCLSKYEKTGQEVFARILRKSLEGMADHGLFDHLDGGFFRLANDRKWASPNYEKLLLTNVQLLEIYHKAAVKLSEPRFEETAVKVIGFIKNWLYQPDEGGFCSAIEAEENYYTLASRAERLKYRDENKRPRVDETFYTDLNAQAVSCLKRAGQKEMPERSLARILKESRGPDGLFYHFKKGDGGYFSQFLTDQVFLTEALLKSDSSLAKEVWPVVVENFYDRQKGGFWDHCLKEDQVLGFLKNGLKPLEENVTAIKLLRQFGLEEEAKKSLVEVFWQNRKANLFSGCLASLVLLG